MIGREVRRGMFPAERLRMRSQVSSASVFDRRVVPMVALAAALSSGCTALGPMAATTGIAAVPAGRPSFEGSIGVMPGHYLSAGVQAQPKGAGIGQAAVMIEPDSIIHVPGLIVGGRYVGSSTSGGYPEPMVGYRTYLGADHLLAVSAIGYATYGSGTRNGASYSATHGGAEAGIDFRVTPEFKWFELHLAAAASLTGISARGSYCIDADHRYGTDCPDPPQSRVGASAGGLYPSGIGSIAIDVGRRLDGEFHGGRIALMGGGGTMPRVIGGQQEGAEPYAAAGLSLTVGFGEGR
jgi:hypothetical protein